MARHVLPQWRGIEAKLTSMPALAAWFVLVALLAMGPLQGFDKKTNGRWAHKYTPGLVDFFNKGTDRIASHDINLPVIVIVALIVSFTARTLRPIVLAALAEGGFYATGGVKLLFARPAPGLHDPRFFVGGWGSDGRFGVSFPSGHATEAVLIYGTVVYIIANYTHISATWMRVVRWLWVLEIINCVLTSYWLGYHWVTDLVGGLIFGALLLRLLLALDRGQPPFQKVPVPHWLAWPRPPRRTAPHSSQPPSSGRGTTRPLSGQGSPPP